MNSKVLVPVNSSETLHKDIVLIKQLWKI